MSLMRLIRNSSDCRDTFYNLSQLNLKNININIKLKLKS